MKLFISETDLTVLDKQAIQADALADAVSLTIETFEVVLGVDDWDQQKREAIARFVRAGAREDLETFLIGLGVAVDVAAEE